MSTLSGGLTTTTGSFSGQVTSTLAIGTAPFSVASTTKVVNLNADRVDNISFDAPTAAGGIPYVSGISGTDYTVGFIGASTSGTILSSGGGGAPSWVAATGFSAGSSRSSAHIDNGNNGDLLYQKSVDVSINTTNSSAVVSVPSVGTSGIQVGQILIGNTNFPNVTLGTGSLPYVVSIDTGANNITVSQAATSAGTVSTKFLSTDKLTIGAANTVLTSSGSAPQWSTSLSLGSTLGVAGNFAVNGTKFTVDSTNGNTSLAGTLTLSSSSDIAVNTNKFTVAAASGNTTIAGTLTLGSASDIAVNTNKFTVAASSGNTVVAGTLGVTGNTTLSGTLRHGGLDPSAGTKIDQIYSATDATLVVTTSWVSTSVNFAELVTGSYMVQVNTGTEYYTGIMSWYDADITSVVTDEIILHRASAGSETSNLFLRVERTDTDLDPTGSGSPNMTLQISSSVARVSASYTYKFRRMI